VVRSDALKNREHILVIAAKAFAASPDASLNSIAKAAGIGPGTLYRHFPTRNALILALYQHEMQALVDAAADLLARHPPMQALRLWFERLAVQIRAKHGAGAALEAVMDASVVEASYLAMTGAVTSLVKAAEKAKAIRPGLDPEDLFFLMGFLWRTPPGKKGEARAKRLMDFVMTGLEPG
jgi:AcrR family transcriptional regulator